MQTVGVDQVTSMIIHFEGSGALASIQYKQGCPSEMVQCSQSGGDPHFLLWTAPHRITFHGECDLVLLRSESFDDGVGLQLHARTTIHSHFAYIESTAVKLGPNVLEIRRDSAILNGDVYDFTTTDPIPEPLVFHSAPPSVPYPSTVYRFVLEEVTAKKRIYRLDLITYCHGKLYYSTLSFKFCGKFLTIRICGHVLDMGDAVGLLGRYFDGAMITRESLDFHEIFAGSHFDFADFASLWQVDPSQGDPLLFEDARSPQLPFETCRVPTVPRPVMVRQRWLRGTEAGVTLEQAQEACRKVTESAVDLELCVDDIMTTGELDLALVW